LQSIMFKNRWKESVIGLLGRGEKGEGNGNGGGLRKGGEGGEEGGWSRGWGEGGKEGKGRGGSRNEGREGGGRRIGWGGLRDRNHPALEWSEGSGGSGNVHGHSHAQVEHRRSGATSGFFLIPRGLKKKERNHSHLTRSGGSKKLRSQRDLCGPLSSARPLNNRRP